MSEGLIGEGLLYIFLPQWS